MDLPQHRLTPHESGIAVAAAGVEEKMKANGGCVSPRAAAHTKWPPEP